MSKSFGPGHERRAGAVFDLAQLIIEGRPHRAMRLYCYRCGKPGTCVANTVAYGAGSAEKEERMVARKFTNMGWEVDTGRGKHFCPDCKTSPPEVTHQESVAMKHTTGSNGAELPVQGSATITPITMSREDRRVIFEKLNEVYLNEREGYAPPWTDDKVAKDLGTPRAWVAQVRDEMFGPICSNTEIEDGVKAAKEVCEAIAKHTAESTKLTGMADAILKRLETISKALGVK